MHSDVYFFAGNICPPLTAPANADVVCYNKRHMCINNCTDGFTKVLSGTHKITCQDDQTWNGVLSGCEGRLWARYGVCTYIHVQIYASAYTMYPFTDMPLKLYTRKFVSMCTNSVYKFMTVI